MSPRLADRVLARKVELEDLLADTPPYEETMRQSIQTALACVYQWMTGDLAHPSSVMSRALSNWLERHRYLSTR